MADITSADFKQLIEVQQETNKLLRLEQAAESKPNPEKFIKEELINIAIAEGNRRAGKKLLEVESNEQESDKETKEDDEALNKGILTEQEKTTKAVLAMGATDDLAARLKVAEDAAQAELTEKANIKSAKETSIFQKMGNFFKDFKKGFDKIPGSKSLMAILKGTLFGGALLALLSFIQSPEFGEILKTLTGPIARGLAYLWQEVILPIGSFFKGVITGDAPWIQGIKKFLEENTPEIISKNSDTVVGVLRGLVGALAVGVLFAPFRTAGLLVGGVWKLTKLIAGITGISKLLSTLGTATAGVGAAAAGAGAAAGISATGGKPLKPGTVNPKTGNIVGTDGKDTTTKGTDPNAKEIKKEIKQKSSKSPLKNVGKVGKNLGRLAGRAFLPVAAVLATVDGVVAAMDADKLLGKEGQDVTGGERAAAAAGGVLEGLSFGLVDAGKTAKGLANFFDAGIKDGITGTNDAMMEMDMATLKALPRSGLKQKPAEQLNPNVQGGNGDAIVLNSRGSINNSVNNQTHQTFATNLFPNDPVMHQVAAAR